MLCLEGVTKLDINNMLDYMYNGEVQIFQDDIDRFLNIAHRFQVKGLQSQSDTADIKDFHEVSEERKIESGTNFSDSKAQHNSNSEVRSSHQGATETIAIVDSSCMINAGVENYIEKSSDGNVNCTLCGKIATDKLLWRKIANMKRHDEIHIEGLSNSCPICGKKFRSKVYEITININIANRD